MPPSKQEGRGGRKEELILYSIHLCELMKPPCLIRARREEDSITSASNDFL